MISSSSDNSPFYGRKEIIEPEEGERGVPLKGVKYDLERFKKRFYNKNHHYIETSN
jgi:hypothetical protein